MAWLQLKLVSNRETARKLSALLEQFGAASVSLTAVSDDILFGQTDNETEALWEQTRITALLFEETDLDTLLVTLSHQAGEDQILQHQIEILPDRDWVGDYQRTHGIRYFGEKLCICPSWCIPPEHISNILYLDPGLAFGTGTHDTTSMCLTWLMENDLSGKTVIDYGCGSGILALAALALGASRAYAVDIDPQALQATRINAEKNKLLDRITIAFPGSIELHTVDILMANVLLNPLKELAVNFADLVRPQGDLVLSGILAVQVDECLAAYQSWFNMTTPIFQREWAMLTGSRK